MNNGCLLPSVARQCVLAPGVESYARKANAVMLTSDKVGKRPERAYWCVLQGQLTITASSPVSRWTDRLIDTNSAFQLMRWVMWGLPGRRFLHCASPALLPLALEPTLLSVPYSRAASAGKGGSRGALGDARKKLEPVCSG